MSATLAGIGASPGLAVGPVARLAGPPVLPSQEPAVADRAAEVRRAAAALESVAVELERRAGAADGAAADVLVITAMMARDPGLADAVAALAGSGRPAPWAVTEAFAGHRAALEAAGGYLAERVADLDDVRARAVAVLLGVPMPGVPRPAHPFVLVADDLAPADTATLDPARVLALVTAGGGVTSHTAILARSLGIPAVVGCPGAAGLADGERVAVDGTGGTVLVAPTGADLAEATSRAQQWAQQREQRLAASHGPGRTADGHPVDLLVNAAGAADAARVAAVEAVGVGLLRTEFLFLGRRTAPTLAEQEAAYREVFGLLGGRTVVIRTLDAGADKPLPFAALQNQPNPALGIRGLRTSWRYPELLDTQLEAIARAAKQCHADAWVMAPMVATAQEAAAFADRARRHGLTRVGVLVEVPAAALAADRVVAAVDFVSLGTNDLSQYAFAADRQAGALAPLLDPWQPALLRLVELTAAAGRAAGKPVGVCGEAAGDPLLATVLVGLGVTSLSMAAGAVAEVRQSLAERTLQRCREAAARALAAPDPAAARAAAGAC
jgi:phosphotransferase system enzyme I (PtsI)